MSCDHRTGLSLCGHAERDDQVWHEHCPHELLSRLTRGTYFIIYTLLFLSFSFLSLSLSNPIYICPALVMQSMDASYPLPEMMLKHLCSSQLKTNVQGQRPQRERVCNLIYSEPIINSLSVPPSQQRAYHVSTA